LFARGARETRCIFLVDVAFIVLFVVVRERALTPSWFVFTSRADFVLDDVRIHVQAN
jgi:hypothetical protein